MLLPLPEPRFPSLYNGERKREAKGRMETVTWGTEDRREAETEIQRYLPAKPCFSSSPGLQTRVPGVLGGEFPLLVLVL